MYGLRRSTRIQKDFTISALPTVDYVSGWHLFRCVSSECDGVTACRLTAGAVQ